MGLLKEFKEFTLRGNVLDLAIAVIIGSAFGKIVTSFVNDVLMPPIGLFLGDKDFSKMKIILRESQSAILDGTEIVSPAISEVSINYGIFTNTIIDFLIIALVIFLIIRSFNRFKKKAESQPSPAPSPSKQELLLTEIRDILKSQK